MHRLFYVSTASPDVDDTILETIVELAQRHNYDNEISGALSFNGFNFAQVLEGERDAIFSLYEKIKRDVRHAGVILIGEKPISERLYSEWGMIKIDGYDFDKLVRKMSF